MSEISTNQPLGTPTWIDLAVPDLDRAKVFYRALFGWEYAERSTATGPFTMCLLRGRRVAALRAASAADVEGESWWHMYLATDDCDATAKRITDGGGTLLAPPSDVADLGRTAVVADPVGARFSLWQGRTLPGCELVNEPCTLVRNDLVAPAPGPARRFYTGAFDFTLDGNDTLPPDFDFTFLRRPDGHEVGGVFGDPAAPRPAGRPCSRSRTPTTSWRARSPRAAPPAPRRTCRTAVSPRSPTRSARSSTSSPARPPRRRPGRR